MKQAEFLAACQRDIDALVERGAQTWRDRLAALNADVADPVTSMDEPFYWVEVGRELQAEMEFEGEYK